ncbi:hypothetical protein ZWY2020_003886 [Hordeum vulgare]|nr:hypothetical protein ZWY2020_003886 [Hordeum vulgare]
MALCGFCLHYGVQWRRRRYGNVTPSFLLPPLRSPCTHLTSPHPLSPAPTQRQRPPPCRCRRTPAAPPAPRRRPPSRYLGSGSGQGRLRLAPVTSRRNSPLLRCSASGGDGGSGADKVVEEHRKRRAELTARISSDEFTALVPFRWLAPVAARLVKLGPHRELAAGLLTKVARGARRGPELPQAVGSLASVAGEAFFLPLYDLFLTYGGVFRLNFGPKVTAPSI